MLAIFVLVSRTTVATTALATTSPSCTITFATSTHTFTAGSHVAVPTCREWVHYFTPLRSTVFGSS
jgi:hypothetical protein